MALFTGLRYARTRIRVPRTGQRVRLAAIITATLQDVFNRTHPFGEYGRAHVADGGPRVSWSSYPTPPFSHETTVSGCEGCLEPAFAWDSRGILHLLVNNGGVVTERTSADHGVTWEAETTRFASGSRPDVAANGTMLLRAAYVAGALSLSRQSDGEAAPGAAFNAKNSLGVDLSLVDDRFRIAGSLDGRWWLHVRLAVGTTSLHYSTDAGATWTPTDGAVAGIASGAHPGIAAGNDGSLYAWAVVAGKLHLSRREFGETAWSTPAAVKDTGGADLLVADTAASIAHAYEEPSRLLLAVLINGETRPSDWWSADRGATWTRFS